MWDNCQLLHHTRSFDTKYKKTPTTKQTSEPSPSPFAAHNNGTIMVRNPFRDTTAAIIPIPITASLSTSSSSTARSGGIPIRCFLVAWTPLLLLSLYLLSSILNDTSYPVYPLPTSLESSSSSIAIRSPNVRVVEGGETTASRTESHTQNNENAAHKTKAQSQSTTKPTTIVLSKDATKTNNHAPWDPAKSAVLGLAAGYGLQSYQDFVGSLRSTGYPGHILLGLATNAPSDVLDYLRQQNVTIHFVEMADSCTYNGTMGFEGKPMDTKDWHCPKAYPDYKITWARFPLYKDWLMDCPTCTDGVMLTDVRDAYFQRDPFAMAVELQMQYPLMVFEEHPDMRNTHWLTDFPITLCKKYKVGETQVLCSGSTMGSREGILDYIDAMVEEFDEWKVQEKCRIDMPGDDQSIHNYLYYTNRFKNATSIPHRTGPIHVVGYEASRIWEKAEAEGKEHGVTVWNVDSFYAKEEDKWQGWLPEEYGLIDQETGLIVNMDGVASAQVHQVDRFGSLNRKWMSKMKEEVWPYNKA